MAETGVKSTDLGSSALLDEVIGNRNGSTIRVPIADLGTQLAGSGPVADALAVIEGQVTTGLVLQPTWTALLALSGSQEGGAAEVLDSDGGTHFAATATGYDGGAVNNAGRYSWHATWSRWVRIADTGLASKAPLASPTFTGTVSGITKAMVGLGSVDDIPAADLLSRANHSGTQPIGTVDGLEGALAAIDSPISVYPALELLGAEIGLAVDFSMQSAVVRDFETPANSFTGSAGGLLTVTRASTATYFDGGLTLSAAANNELRYDHDATGPLGLLVEPAATNLALYSEDMTTARSWTQSNGTVTSNAAVAPDGTTTMEAFVEDTTNAAHILTRQIASTLSGETYWWSGFVKKGGNRYAQFHFGGGGIPSSETPAGVIDFDTGEFFPVSPVATVSGPSAPEVALVDCGNGFFWVAIKTTTTSTANLQPRFYGSADGTYDGRSYAGTAARIALYVWGGQVTKSVLPTSYIKTEGATASRSADLVTLATSDFPWNHERGTIYVQARAPFAAAKTVLWQADDGSESNRFRIERDASNHLRFIVTAASTEMCNIDLGVVGHNRGFQVTASWAEDRFSASIDGAAAVMDTSGALPTGLTTMRFGSSVTGEQWGRHIQKLAYTPRRVI